MSTQQKIFGVVAEFNSSAEIFHACEKVRDNGFKNWDAHTPFPVHGLEKAMGLKPSILPWMVLVAGITGGSLAFFFQWWINVVDYPLVISGKPFFSWQAFIPVTFEVTVLFSALTAVFGMFAINKLPQFYHPVFRSNRFARVTDDKFFISIEATDPKFSVETTSALLKAAGAVSVEVVEQ